MEVDLDLLLDLVFFLETDGDSDLVLFTEVDRDLVGDFDLFLISGLEGDFDFSSMELDLDFNSLELPEVDLDLDILASH